jgi:hypothetical protein
MKKQILADVKEMIKKYEPTNPTFVQMMLNVFNGKNYDYYEVRNTFDTLLVNGEIKKVTDTSYEIA